MTVARSRLWLTAFFAGFAQLAFCSTLPAGILVALGLGLFSPWILVGAAAGCLVGTIAGRLGPGMTTERWTSGLAGFNPAILGVVGAGTLAAGQPDAFWLSVWFLSAVALGRVMARPFNRIGLYPLSAPAYLIAVLASLALAPAGTWWWSSVDTTAFGDYGPWIATICIAAAMSYEAPEAAGWAVLSSVLAFLLAVEFLGFQPWDAAGLWGVVVPLSAFASLRLFGKRVMPALALSAAALAAIIWLIWQASPLGAAFPPLVAPMIAALWIVMILRRCRLPTLVQPAFWHCFSALARARRKGRIAGVVTGPSSFELEDLDAGGGDRRLHAGDQQDWQKLWSTADKLRSLDGGAFDPGVAAVQWAVRAKVVDLVIAGDAIGQFDGIDETKRIDAAGRADRLSCLACGEITPWPPAALWRRMALRCSCGGLFLPDLRVQGRASDHTLDNEILERCQGAPGVLLVLDPPGGTMPVRRSLLNRMQANGGEVFRVSHSAQSSDPGTGSQCRILGNTALVLRALTLLVAIWPNHSRWLGAPGRSQPDSGKTI